MLKEGDTVRLKAEFRDFDGNLISPDDVKLTLYDEKREVVAEYDLVPLSEGVYRYDYIIPENEGSLMYYEFRGLVHGFPTIGRGRFVKGWLRL